jgi:hypothetical protein
MDYLQILERFRKANSKYKLSMAKKQGFNTAEEYADFLASKTGKRVKIRKPKIEPLKTTDTSMVKNMESVDEFGVTMIGGTNSTVKQDLDLIIAFDSTGSMSHYIQAVRNHVSSLVDSMLQENPYVNIGIVVFGDYCDMQNATTFGRAYQVLSPTRDARQLENFIRTSKNTFGGDVDEFYELVLEKILTETPWRDSANKAVLLIGDAGPHIKEHRYKFNYPVSPDWREVCEGMAKAGIIVDTLDIKNVSFYREVAKITGGVCIPFNNSAKTVELLEATSLARGGVVTEAAFMAKSMTVENSSDEDMKKVYGMYKNMK